MRSYLRLNRMRQPISVKWKQYNGLMPAHSFLSDAELAQVINYIRQNFNNNSSAVTPGEI